MLHLADPIPLRNIWEEMNMLGAAYVAAYLGVQFTMFNYL